MPPHENGGRGGGGGFGRAGTGDNNDATSLASPNFGGVHLSSLPICEANSSYVKAQRVAFESGSRPPVFSPLGGDRGEGEGGVKGKEGGEGDFIARASREELTRGGKQAMGLWRYTKEHYNPALEVHHELLEIAYKW